MPKGEKLCVIEGTRYGVSCRKFLCICPDPVMGQKIIGELYHPKCHVPFDVRENVLCCAEELRGERLG